MECIFTIIIPIATLVLGAWLAYISSSKISLKNKIREKRIDYLIKAYTLIGHVSSRAILFDSSEADKLNEAVNLINLLGTNEQIDLARKMIEKIESDNLVPDDLLLDLKSDLRKELKLKKNHEKVFRIKVVEKKNS